MAIPHTQHTADQISTPAARLVVVTASVREDRMGLSIADWVTKVASNSFTVDPIDLATVELPDDRLLEPGGGPSDQLASSVGLSVILPATLILIAFVTCLATMRRSTRQVPVDFAGTEFSVRDSTARPFS